MTDNPKNVRNMPDRAPAPAVELPDLPCDSGVSTWFRSRQEVCEFDTDYVDATTNLYRAQARQTLAVDELVAARVRLARTLSALQALPEICLREQEHKLRMLALKNEAEATEAAIILAEARSRLSQVMAGHKQVAPAGNDRLSIDDVESILVQFPEFDEASIGRITMLLRALQKEKSK